MGWRRQVGEDEGWVGEDMGWIDGGGSTEDEDKGCVGEDEGWVGGEACMHNGGVVCRWVVLGITGSTLFLLGLGLA